MSLIRLEVTGIRNITQASLDLHPKINLIYGANGSGKTSLLESVYFLGSARSFRNASITPLITRSHEECLVRGEVDSEFGQHTLGVLRNRDGGREMKIDRDETRKATDLANLLPTLVLGPETVNLLIGAPGLRRRFLNWGVFHVEHSFNQVWMEANRCLKQRNTLLRHWSHKQGQDELGVWTRELIRHAEELDRIRTVYSSLYGEVFLEHCSRLTDLEGVTYQYYRGWSESQSLAEIYENDQEIDRKRGYTTRGFHRADVRIKVNGQDVSVVCSRGELKVLSWAMIFSQGSLLKGSAASNLVFLVDDLGSELDEHHRQSFCDHLMSTGNQILATGIDQDTLTASWHGQELNMFHVEHGAVTLGTAAKGS
jgi:DNA replication and repair protein RecF